MAIFPSTPSLRARVLPRFPANVIAGNGISISKSGGTYTFALTPIDDLPLASLVNINSNRLLGRDAVGVGPVSEMAVSTGLGFTGTGSLQVLDNQRLRSLVFQSATVTAGVKGDISVPFNCVIQRVTLLADAAVATNPLIVEIWKDTFANYPPVVGDSIVASAKPTINIAAQSGQISVLTGWTTVITAGDTLRFNVVAPAATGATRVAICIDVLAS